MKNHIWLNSQIIINAGQYFIGNSLIDELENEFSANDVLWNNLHQVRYKNNLHQVRSKLTFIRYDQK